MKSMREREREGEQSQKRNQIREDVQTFRLFARSHSLDLWSQPVEKRLVVICICRESGAKVWMTTGGLDFRPCFGSLPLRFTHHDRGEMRELANGLK